MAVYFISDTHFGHEKMIKYENRPFKNTEEMDQELIKRWNKKVKKMDLVYILGDFAFGKPDYIIRILKQLNGKKFLIKGNHDHFVKYPEVVEQFQWIKEYHMLRNNGRKIVLSHFPILVWDCKHYGSYHLYGHVHSDANGEISCDMGKALNVGADVNDFAPISLEEVISKLKNK